MTIWKKKFLDSAAATAAPAKLSDLWTRLARLIVNQMNHRGVVAGSSRAAAGAAHSRDARAAATAPKPRGPNQPLVALVFFLEKKNKKRKIQEERDKKNVVGQRARLPHIVPLSLVLFELWRDAGDILQPIGAIRRQREIFQTVYAVTKDLQILRTSFFNCIVKEV